MCALALLLLASVLSCGCMVPVGKDSVNYDLNWVFLHPADIEPADYVCDVSPAAKLLRTQGLDRDHCYQEVAVRTENLPLCEKVNRDPPMTKCYLRIAAKQNNPAICDQIPPTTDAQAYLKIDCLWEVAMKNNNKAACEAMGNQKISRMFMGEMSRQTCIQRLVIGQAALARLTED